MTLENFRLIDEPLSICIKSNEQVWDLHNVFDFAEIRQDIRRRSVSLLWQSCPSPSSVSAQGLEIIFAEVDYFEITPRDTEIPDFGEDLCLAGLSRIEPDSDSLEIMAQGIPILEFLDGQFHLWFSFRSGQNIRVGAETAVLKMTL